MSHLRPELRQRAEEIVALYPKPRSATVPLCHLAQEQDGYLTEDAMLEIAELTGTTPAEVFGTASFYDLLHLQPVGAYVVGVCTNIACLLAGGLELLAHAAGALGVPVGSTTPDGTFTLEECECLGDCDVAPCVQVNGRFVRTTTPAALDGLLAELRDGGRTAEIPRFGTLSRVRRSGGLAVPRDQVAAERTRVRLATAPPNGSSS
ncbi:MAG TPA: NAD(P)H-dependent oxidoreductase subunit E [Acidimicrobiales bacterium]|nr:NAD(P)H-dependent oxidoreductase subunit E [Acidimicrobiales bacterium]